MRKPTAIDAIADAYVDALALRSPLAATAMGIPGHEHSLDEFDPEYHASLAELDANALRQLDAVEPIDEVDAVTLAAMRERLGLSVELHEAGEWRGELNVIESPLQAIRDTFDLMPQASEADWTAIAARLALVPRALEGYARSLAAGVAEGPRPARRQVVACIEQARAVSDPATSTLAALVASAPVPDALASDLQRGAALAGQAYGALADFLRDEVLPGAPEHDAVGRERYERFSRRFVSARVDLDETYAWGVDQLAEITAEMDALQAEIAGPGASFADAAAALDADPARILEGTDALQRWMQDTSDAAVAALDGREFDIASQARTLACRIAPSASGGIYYTAPSDDFSRAGTMWWSVPEGVTRFTTWNEKTTVYHEGVPGHHLQIAAAVANRDLNAWRRLVCWTSGHGEGWALYAEKLMAEFGFLDDPGDRLGMLDAQRLRATRVVLDIGLHLGKPALPTYGSGAWDAESAWRLLRANSGMDEAFLAFEFDRYLGWPGQAPSYKIGQRIWEELRAEAAARAAASGAEFSLRDFHARALGLGSLPLDVLRAELARG